MRKISEIVIHISDSPFGDVEAINQWHLDRGWSEIGYHKVILNGKRTSKSKYQEKLDGYIESGRKMMTIGAHAVGNNQLSIGYCLIGKTVDGVSSFTPRQLDALMRDLLIEMDVHNIPVEKVIGHYETKFPNGKTCPDMDMINFREHLEDYINTHTSTYHEETSY